MSELLRVDNLVQQFHLDKSFLDKVKLKDGKVVLEERVVQAVNSISFSVEKGEAFGLVGESGCGKSTTARTIIGLNKPTSGEIYFDGQPIDRQANRAHFAQQMQMIFQDPHASLNPRMTVLEIVSEPILFHKLAKNKKDATQKAEEILARVGIRPEQSDRYPHQFSGGQRQRIGIARALAVNPQFIIADEPVSALDVSIQAQILNLLMDLKDDLGLSYLFIAHDLSVVQHLCDRLAVMYLGRIVEMGTREQIFDRPTHPYTKLLMAVAPKLTGNNIENYEIPETEMPTVLNLPRGCAFCGRCKYATPQCEESVPQPVEVTAGHVVACHNWNTL